MLETWSQIQLLVLFKSDIRAKVCKRSNICASQNIYYDSLVLGTVQRRSR